MREPPLTDEQILERFDQMDEKLKLGPSFNTKQLAAILIVFSGTVFAAGAWANSINQGLASNNETLVEIRADLKQLGEVAVLKAQVDNLKQQINLMQIRLDASGR